MSGSLKKAKIEAILKKEARKGFKMYYVKYHVIRYSPINFQ